MSYLFQQVRVEAMRQEALQDAHVRHRRSRVQQRRPALWR